MDPAALLNAQECRGRFVSWQQEEGVLLRRIFFDGYGCCETEDRCAALPSSDAMTPINAIRENDVNNKSILDILRRYFAENASIIWSDALNEHQLNGSGPNVR